MNSRCKRPSSSKHRSGFTLVEVVASLVLMGSLLASALLGLEKHTRQLRAAQLRQDAVHFLDQRLARLPAGSQLKALEQHAEASFQIQVDYRTLNIAPELELRIARLSVHTAGTPEPVVRIEMVESLSLGT